MPNTKQYCAGCKFLHSDFFLNLLADILKACNFTGSGTQVKIAICWQEPKNELSEVDANPARARGVKKCVKMITPMLRITNILESYQLGLL